MAGVQEFNEQLPVVRGWPFTSADTPGVYKQYVPSKTLNARLDSITALNTDTVDHLLSATIQDEAGVSIVLGSVNVLAGAGAGTVPICDVLAGLTVTDHKRLLWLSGAYLAVTFATAITATKTVVLLAQGGYTL